MQKYDTSKGGQFSHAYGDFFRFATEFFNFTDGTEEGWKSLIKESGMLCNQQTNTSHELFIRHLFVSFLSWKDKQIRSDAPAPILDTQFRSMLIDYWNYISGDVNQKYHGNGFWTKWADVPFAEELMNNYRYLTQR